MWHAWQMVMKFVPPKYQATRFNCPRCGAFAAQEWRELAAEGDYEYNQATHDPVMDSAPDGAASKGELAWEACLCAGCERHSLWIGGVLAYPIGTATGTVPEPVEGMPDEVRELYLEASAVFPHSRRAAAALCRASLERLAKHLTPDLPAGRSLDERLIVLSGKTTESLTQAVQFIRHAGNTALHGARDDDESVVIYMDGDETDLIDLFFVTINELVNELVLRPARIQAAYEMLPVEKRESIERKLQAAREVGGNPERNEAAPRQS